MKRLLEIAKNRGITRIMGVISPDNESMLNIARKNQAELIEMEDGNFTAAMIVGGQQWRNL
ncbi:hypothetical protein D1AOALGA4SA_8049 [Olavius algarvensis Delta 1 endosymbiont]|nr:hypothetical protein D1AOALGA4SA_8049 [Olavius algarvensis Delta 1 endosymbiont]